MEMKRCCEKDWKNDKRYASNFFNIYILWYWCFKIGSIPIYHTCRQGQYNLLWAGLKRICRLWGATCLSKSCNSIKLTVEKWDK
jgi:hypothetical protein